jgi:N-acetylglucosaminyl-diphospho-decaprenol L-rhamnosyltransferase
MPIDDGLSADAMPAAPAAGPHNADGVDDASGRPPGVAAAVEQVTLVIVTYNSGDVLRRTLPAVAHLPHLVVVDNHSADDTLAVVQALIPQAQVIALDRNLGYGRANNRGLAASRTPFALVANPDALLTPSAVAALVAGAHRHPDAAVLGPVLLDAPGVVGDFYRIDGQSPTSPRRAPDRDLEVDFVSGAVMLMRLDAMQPIGFFDPWFFLYHEDDELCARVRAAGRRIVVVADAVVEHHTRGSSRPSWRTSWRRSYCRTLSKLYLRRRQADGAWIPEALRIGAGSLLALPLHLAAMRGERIARHAARVAAACTAAWHLDRPHCFEPRD